MSHYFSDQEAKPLEVEGVPLLWEEEQQQINQASASSSANRTPVHAYPGMRRTPLPAPNDNNTAAAMQDKVLIPTAGNALQAVPRHITERPNMLRVTVPENSSPGDPLLVRYEDNNNNSNNYLEVTIPQGLLPGHAFFVEIPTTTEIPVFHATGEAIQQPPSQETKNEPSDLELYKV